MPEHVVLDEQAPHAAEEPSGDCVVAATHADTLVVPKDGGPSGPPWIEDRARLAVVLRSIVLNHERAVIARGHWNDDAGSC